MSDPFRDPRHDPTPMREQEVPGNRYGSLGAVKGLWGWMAGAAVLLLVLILVFGRGPNTSDTAGTMAPSPEGAKIGEQSVPATPPATTGRATTPSTSGQSTR
jgi:hypothetical protein